MRIDEFLNDIRNDTEFYTHVSMGSIKGKYQITKKNSEIFWRLYMDNVVDGSRQMSLAERASCYPPVLADVDLKFKDQGDDVKMAFHTEAHILRLVKMYQSVIREVIEDCRDETLICFVLNKPPYRIDGYIKNGFHLHFPFCFLKDEHQNNIILPRVKDLLRDSRLFEDIGIEDSSSVLDNVTSKPWLLYGSSKGPGMDPYLLTKIYDQYHRPISLEDAMQNCEIFDSEGENIQIDPNKSMEYYLPRILSIKLNNRRVEGLKKNLLRYQLGVVARNRRKVSGRKSTGKVKCDMDFVKRLIDLLSSSRASNYNDWMTVGWCLYNITDGSDKGLDLWDEFSKKCETKYEEGQTTTQWDRMVNHNKYSVGTLRYFASIDSPGEYEKLKKEQVNEKCCKIKSLDSASHYDFAGIMFAYYSDEFKCSSVSNKTWHQWVGCKWEPMDDGVELRKRISAGVLMDTYKKQRQDAYTACGQLTNDVVMKQYEDVIKSLKKIIKSLKDNTFKSKLMKECMDLFYDKNFRNKLDKDPQLFPFKNGVYDLRVDTFRETRPEDYISNTAPIEYMEYGMDHPEVKNVQRFLSQIFPNRQLREYFMTISSDVFQGGNFMKKAYFWTGEGDNGKSVTQMLFDKMLGKLVVKLPTTIITGKKVNPGAACPELARTSNGVRLATMEEPDNDEQINVGTFKMLTGNDTYFARDLFEKGKETREITPMFKFVFICNKLPTIKHADEATFNRIRVIPFESTFVKPGGNVPDTFAEQLKAKRFPQDPNFDKKLKAMAPAFAWLLLQHRKKIKVSRPYEPDIVKEATRLYKRKNDVYLNFTENYIVKEENSRLSMTDLYKYFKSYCEAEGISKKDIPKRREVEAFFVRKKSLGPFTGKGKKWSGYMIVDPDADEDAAVYMD